MVDNLSAKFEQALILTSSKNTDTSCLLLGLPVELVLYILSLLDPRHVALFSLTCKASSRLVRGTDYGKVCLASIHSALHTDLDQASRERTEFLHHLVKDLPHMFVCKRCSKLHRNLVSLVEEGPHALKNYTSICRQKGLMTFGTLWPQYAFTCKQGREAIRNCSSGMEPNLATSHLSISTDWKLRRLGTSCNNPDFIHGYVKLDTEAAVENDNLYFHKIQRILLLPDRVKPFLKANASSPMEQVFQSCCHGTEFRSTFRPFLDLLDWNGLHKMSVHDTISKFVTMAHESLFSTKPAGLDGYDLERVSLPNYWFAGCKHCTTDSITTIHNHGRSGVEIVNDTYQDLGDCIDHVIRNCDRYVGNEWGHCWSGLSYEYRILLSRRQDHPQVNAGIFMTRPGTSAIHHPSAPSTQDIWELHDHDRAAKSRSS
ncbi:hypothetical protein F5Y00DRAFT_231104 [Daldinia vernicosa]|uniref:uncharacterized protein n=1 Tax=Daldinia vernicosa TaxID=114800 RepID=UPI002008B685|nr:uncharacterized protein F5Y00DRAFT_231104 [Daldinia vernicosa]KAI0850897.1 hypothetical protein F5Y00DRAFT_231104 [Daldinia vernicosa]